MKPMRYISLIIALLSVLGLAAQQQQSQYALYNYRNDGDFNAWLNIDVDSITYSNIGLDSVEYDNIVTQEVWTPDSCYRIPIEVIDSIGFRAPKPEYKDDVFHITIEHIPYITAVDSFTITFLSSLPVLMRPTVGQVVTSDTFEEPLTDGFAGKVLEINDDGERVTIICEGASVTDVFKRLVLVGKGVGVNEEEAKSRPLRKPRKIWGDYEDYDNIEFEFPGKVSVKINDFLSIEDEVSMAADYYVYVDLPRFKMRATATGTHNLKTSWSIDSDKILEWMGVERDKFEPDWATPFWPVVAIPGVFSFGVKLGGFLDPSVKLSLTGSTPITFTHTFGVEFSNTDTYVMFPMITPIANVHSELGTPEISLSLEGKLFAGIALGLKTKLIADNVVHGDITGRFGPEFDAKIQMKQTLGEGDPISWYSLLKDSKVGVQIKADAKVKAKVFGKNMTENLAWDWKWPIPGWEDTRYLFPDFTKPELPHYLMPEPLSLYSKASRDVIMPVQLGIGVFDEDGIKQREYYCEDWYLLDAENHSIPRVYIGDLPTGTKYTCRPIFNFSGIGEIKADPEIEFTVPEPMTLNINTPLNTVTLSKGQDGFYAINGGWGEYSAHSSMRAICNAEIVMNNDKPYVKISASKLLTGPATVTVKDLRDGATKTIHVIVSNSSVPELTVSEQAVALQESESIKVLVTSGSGNYTVESSDENVATATIEGNEIIITAISIGPASVTITDTETKQEVTIEVSVSEAGGNDNTHGEAGQAEYDAAMAAITNGSYYISTKVGGAKYYLTTEGRLTNIKEDRGLFAISKTSGGGLYDVGINIDPGTGYHFTNTTLVNEKANLHPGTGAFYMTNNFNRNNWERQVLFLNETGKFAIRTSNTAYGTESWEDAGRTFWTYEVNETGAPVLDNYGLMACYSYEPTYIWEINKTENLDILPSTILSPEIQWSADIMVFNDSERYGTSADGQVIDTPPSDASGNEWYAPNYKLTNGQKSWNVGYSPFLSETTTTEINAVNWTTWSNSTCWSADKDVADIYMRRTFTVDHALSDRILLSCCHDDAAEWYLNGVLIHSETGYNWNYNYNNSIYLTPEQRALIHTDGRKNVLSVHVHNYGGPALADEGLYEVRE